MRPRHPTQHNLRHHWSPGSRAHGELGRDTPGHLATTMNSQQPYLLPWQNMYGLQQQQQQQQQQLQLQQLQLGKLGLQLPQQQLPLSISNGLSFPGLAGGCMSLPASPGLTLAGSQLYPIMSPQLAAFPAHQQQQLQLQQQQLLAGHPSIPGLQKLFMPSVKVGCAWGAVGAREHATVQSCHGDQGPPL